MVLFVILLPKKYIFMPQLVVTVSDHAALPLLRTAIRQLRGVEQVSIVRELKPQTNSQMCEQQKELLQRVDELQELKRGWDNNDSKAIDTIAIRKFKSAINKMTGDMLDGWVLFPEAHGYLYFDFSGNDTIAGITMTGDKIVYFIRKNGKIQKNDGIAFNTRNLISILKRVHG